MLVIYIDDTRVLSPNSQPFGAYYINVTTTGAVIRDDEDSNPNNQITWTYTGSDEFLGLSTTQGATTPDQGYSVGSMYTYPPDGPLYLYSVTTSASSELITVKYNNTTVYATSEDGAFKLTTKGKVLEYNIDIDATIETPLIDDATATAGDVLSSYTAYVNDNEKITGTMAIYTGGVSAINNITFTIDGNEYTVVEGTTWAEWVQNNSDNFEIVFMNGSGCGIIDTTKSTITDFNYNVGYRICNGTLYYIKQSNNITYYSTTIIQHEDLTTSSGYFNNPL